MYDIDGIIVQTNIQHLDQNEKGNPEYAFAFKKDIYITTVVEDVIWKLTSKDGKIIPSVKIAEVNLGNTMKQPAGKNARFIINNKIGIGAKIVVTFGGDVIPNIVRVIEPSPPEMMVYPDLPKDSYDWNESGVHFILIDHHQNENVQISKINYFMSHMI